MKPKNAHINSIINQAPGTFDQRKSLEILIQEHCKIDTSQTGIMKKFSKTYCSAIVCQLPPKFELNQANITVRCGFFAQSTSIEFSKKTHSVSMNVEFIW
jgi:hypothetical protein